MNARRRADPVPQRRGVRSPGAPRARDQPVRSVRDRRRDPRGLADARRGADARARMQRSALAHTGDVARRAARDRRGPPVERVTRSRLWSSASAIAPRSVTTPAGLPTTRSAASTTAGATSGPLAATAHVQRPAARSRSSAANASRSPTSSPANSTASRSSPWTRACTSPFRGAPTGISSRIALPGRARARARPRPPRAPSSASAAASGSGGRGSARRPRLLHLHPRADRLGDVSISRSVPREGRPLEPVRPDDPDAGDIHHTPDVLGRPSRHERDDATRPTSRARRSPPPGALRRPPGGTRSARGSRRVEHDPARSRARPRPRRPHRFASSSERRALHAPYRPRSRVEPGLRDQPAAPIADPTCPSSILASARSTSEHRLQLLRGPDAVQPVHRLGRAVTDTLPERDRGVRVALDGRHRTQLGGELVAPPRERGRGFPRVHYVATEDRSIRSTSPPTASISLALGGPERPAWRVPVVARAPCRPRSRSRRTGRRGRRGERDPTPSGRLHLVEDHLDRAGSRRSVPHRLAYALRDVARGLPGSRPRGCGPRARSPRRNGARRRAELAHVLVAGRPPSRRRRPRGWQRGGLPDVRGPPSRTRAGRRTRPVARGPRDCGQVEDHLDPVELEHVQSAGCLVDRRRERSEPLADVVEVGAGCVRAPAPPPSRSAPSSARPLERRRAACARKRSARSDGLPSAPSARRAVPARGRSPSVRDAPIDRRSRSCASRTGSPGRRCAAASPDEGIVGVQDGPAGLGHGLDHDLLHGGELLERVHLAEPEVVAGHVRHDADVVAPVAEALPQDPARATSNTAMSTRGFCSTICADLGLRRRRAARVARRCRRRRSRSSRPCGRALGRCARSSASSVSRSNPSRPRSGSGTACRPGTVHRPASRRTAALLGRMGMPEAGCRVHLHDRAAGLADRERCRGRGSRSPRRRDRRHAPPPPRSRRCPRALPRAIDRDATGRHVAGRYTAGPARPPAERRPARTCSRTNSSALASTAIRVSTFSWPIPRRGSWFVISTSSRTCASPSPTTCAGTRSAIATMRPSTTRTR